MRPTMRVERGARRWLAGVLAVAGLLSGRTAHAGDFWHDEYTVERCDEATVFASECSDSDQSLVHFVEELRAGTWHGTVLPPFPPAPGARAAAAPGAPYRPAILGASLYWGLRIGHVSGAFDLGMGAAGDQDSTTLGFNLAFALDDSWRWRWLELYAGPTVLGDIADRTGPALPPDPNGYVPHEESSARGLALGADLGFRVYLTHALVIGAYLRAPLLGDAQVVSWGLSFGAITTPR